MRILDLFCGEGGAAMGYWQAFPGTEITGVDNVHQPRYPFDFIQADAMTFDLDGYDLIHASPPCQGYSQMQNMTWNDDHPKLIGPVRARLLESGAPYVIENVGGARSQLVAPVELCGCMFGLTVEIDDHVFALRRKRLFETSFPVLQPGHKSHDLPCMPVVGKIGDNPSWWRERYPDIGCRRAKEARRKLMGCGWMSDDHVAQAVPPAFTRYIGEGFQAAGERSAAA